MEDGAGRPAAGWVRLAAAPGRAAAAPVDAGGVAAVRACGASGRAAVAPWLRVAGAEGVLPCTGRARAGRVGWLAGSAAPQPVRQASPTAMIAHAIRLSRLRLATGSSTVITPPAQRLIVTCIVRRERCGEGRCARVHGTGRDWTGEGGV